MVSAFAIVFAIYYVLQGDGKGFMLAMILHALS